jgi:hypothetical protein
MSNLKPDTTLAGVQLDRRGFLTGFGLAVTGLPLQCFAMDNCVVRKPGQAQRAIFQQQAYFDFDGVGDRYEAPLGNQATRDYVASLNEESFLRRHWFT